MSSLLSEVPRAAWIFAVLALVFGALWVRARLRGADSGGVQRKAWLRLALIFAAVAIVLIATRPA